MRLLVGTTGGMLLLLLCLSLILYASIRQALLSEFDRSLASTAEILASGIEIDANEIEADFHVEQMPQFNDPEHPAFYQIWKSDGTVIAKSPLLGALDLPRFRDAAGVSTPQTIRGPDGHLSLRAVGMTFSPRRDEEQREEATPPSEGQTLAMAVARDAGILWRQLSSLRWLLLGATSATAGLALLVSLFVVGRGLRPLQSIATEIAAISEEDLDIRIGNGTIPQEITGIRDRLNALLSRLQEAFERERRFSSNIAHELRNPLAGMRSTIEVALTRSRDSDEYRSTLCECLRIAVDMQAMVNNLLLLARIDAAQMVFQMERIVLFDMAAASWETLAPDARTRELTFDNRIPRALTVICDRQSLGLIFSNLFGNAVEYADHGGRVWTQAQETDGSIEILVGNTGCRLAADQATRVFDRFWRADSSRSETGTHCGLGLSLVSSIARALDGSARVTVEGEVFVTRIELPRRSPSQPSGV